MARGGEIMSRFCGETDPKEILKAAAIWRDRALLGESSVLTDKKLWTVEVLNTLDRHYVQRLDEGEGTFLEKLKTQLAEAGSAAIQLAAEMMWLLYLCPSRITPAKKRQTLQTIWSWSGEVFPAESPQLRREILEGVGSAGTGFNTNQWRELVFVIVLARQFRELSPEDRQRVLGDGWAFDEWVSRLPDAESRQFRHMVLFLLFPDSFERIFGQTDRRAILLAFTRRDRRDIARMSNLEVDRDLFGIRAEQEKKHGRKDLDFYFPPLRDEWKSESLTERAASVTREHVLSALRRIDIGGVPSEAKSVLYDLVHETKRYPPKYVLSLAVEEATGEALDRAAFTGGTDSICFRILRDRGFEIVGKHDETEIRSTLDDFLKQAKAGTELATARYQKEYRGLRVKVSFGQGTISNVPWIAWLGGEEKVSEGIYPVLLFFKAERKLLLCYGVSETRAPKRRWSNIGDSQTVRDWFTATLNREPYRYGSSYVAAVFDSESADIEAIRQKLHDVIEKYQQVLDQQPEVHDDPRDLDSDDLLPARIDIRAAAESFSDALLEAGVSFGERHALTVRSFLACLLTKPLVIITGLSGSGKSQIALQLGEWLGADRVLMMPVRPDWTGSDALFGYEDGLKPLVDGMPAWSVPPTLSFILKAAEDPQQPYLLILDEMNLAHVERYFADVLSGMESGQPCIPELRLGNDGCWRAVRRGARLRFPRNLWIVGTVNVDETTYMFSPKVLDRANTLEFRVLTSDLTVSRKKPGACARGDKELIRGLQQVATDNDWHVAHPFTEEAHLVKSLHGLHRLLSQFGLEFGHRVFYEAVRFAAFSEQAGVSGLHQVLDLVVLQKILPRLHGSRRRIEAPICALRMFCRDPDMDASWQPAVQATDSGADESGVLLPGSFVKLGRMLRGVRSNQFVSFSE
jgi:5-methylcytosine-specific restriction protein B